MNLYDKASVREIFDRIGDTTDVYSIDNAVADIVSLIELRDKFRDETVKLNGALAEAHKELADALAKRGVAMAEAAHLRGYVERVKEMDPKHDHRAELLKMVALMQSEN